MALSLSLCLCHLGWLWQGQWGRTRRVQVLRSCGGVLVGDSQGMWYGGAVHGCARLHRAEVGCTMLCCAAEHHLVLNHTILC